MFFKSGFFSKDIPGTETYHLRLSGTVASGNTALKTVWVYRRNDGKLLSQTSVNPDGTWVIYLPSEAEENLLVICRDEGGDYNADVYDRVSQCTDAILTSDEYTVEVYKPKPIVAFSDTAFSEKNVLSNIASYENLPLTLSIFEEKIVQNYRDKWGNVTLKLEKGRVVHIYQGKDSQCVVDHFQPNFDVFGDGAQVCTVDFTGSIIDNNSGGSGPRYLKDVAEQYSGVHNNEFRRRRANSDSTIDLLSGWFDWEQDYTFCINLKFFNTYNYTNKSRLLTIRNFFEISVDDGHIWLTPGNGSNTGYGSRIDLGAVSYKIYLSRLDIFIHYSKDSVRVYIPGLFDSGAVSWGPLSTGPVYPISWYASYNTDCNIILKYFVAFNRLLSDSEFSYFKKNFYSKDITNASVYESYIKDGLIHPVTVKPAAVYSGSDFSDKINRRAWGCRAVNPKQYSVEFGKPSEMSAFITPLGLSANTAFDNSDGGSVGDESTLYVAVRFIPKKTGTVQSIVKSGDSQNGIAVGLDSGGHVGVYGRDTGALTSIVSSIILEEGVEYIVVATHSELTIYDIGLNVLETVSGTLTVADSTKTLSVGQVVGESVISGTTDQETFIGEVFWVSFFDNTPELGTACYKTIAAEYMGQQVNVPIMIEKWRADQDDIRMWVQLPKVYSGQDTYFDLYFSQDNYQNRNVGIQGVDPDLFTVGADYVAHTDVEYSVTDPESVVPGNWLDAHTKLLLRSDAKAQDELIYDAVFQQTIFNTGVIHDSIVRAVGRTALRFGGSGYIRVQQSSDLDLTQAWTVHCKLSHHLDSYSGFYTLFSEWSDGGSDTFFKFGINSSGNLAFEVYTSSLEVFDTGVSLTKDQIYDLEINFDGVSTFTVLVDGVVESTSTLGDTISNFNFDFIVGAIRMANSTNYDEYWMGTVEEFAFDAGIARHTSNFTPNNDFKRFPATGTVYEVSSGKPKIALPQIPLKFHFSRATGKYNLDMRKVCDKLCENIEHVPYLSLLINTPQHRDVFILDDSPYIHSVAQFNTSYVDTGDVNFPRAINFNGIDAVLELDATDPALYLSLEPDTSVFGSVDFTLEAYVYHNTGEFSFIYYIGHPGSSGGSIPAHRQGIGLYIGTDDQLHVRAGNLNLDTDAGYLHLYGSTDIPTGGCHIAFCVKDNQIYAFINGVPENLSVYGSSAAATDLSSCRLYVPRKVNIGARYSFNNSYDTTFDDSMDYGSGQITNLRLLKGKALWTSNFTPPVKPYTGIELERLSVVSKETKKPLYAETAFFDKEEGCLTFLFSNEDFGPADYEALVYVSENKNYFTGRTGEIPSSKIYDDDYLFTHHLLGRSFHKGSHAIDSTRKHHALYSSDTPLRGVFTTKYGYHLSSNGNLSNQYFTFEEGSQNIWGGLQTVTASVACYDMFRHLNASDKYLTILTDYYSSTSVSFRMAVANYYGTYPYINYFYDGSNYIYTGGKKECRELIYRDGYFFMASTFSLSKGQFFCSIPECPYNGSEYSISSGLVSVSNRPFIGKNPVKAYSAFSFSFLWMSKVVRSEEYIRYLQNNLYDKNTFEVKIYETAPCLLGWEHADRLRIIIPAGTVPSDEVDYPVEIHISDSSGSNGFDATSFLDKYKKDISLVSSTVKTFDFGFDRGGFAGLWLDHTDITEDRFGNQAYPFSRDNKRSWLAHISDKFINNLIHKTEGSISFWVKSSSQELSSTTDYDYYIFGKKYDTSNPYWAAAIRRNWYNNFRLKFDVPSTNAYSPDEYYVANDWIHVVLSYDLKTGKVRVYFNGKYRTSLDISPSSLSYRADYSFTIGFMEIMTRYFDGVLDNFLITDYTVDSFTKASVLKVAEPVRYDVDKTVSILHFDNILLPALKGIDLNSIDMGGNFECLLSFDERTFYAYQGTWEALVSDDSSIHSGTDGDWMYKVGSEWVPAPDRVTAVQRVYALRKTNTSDELNSLTNTEFSQGYDSTVGKLSIALVLEDVTEIPIINGGFLWFSDIYDLEKYTETDSVKACRVVWDYRADDIIEVWVAKTGTADWVLCTNGDQVPGVSIGDDPAGVQLQFRVFIHNKTREDDQTRIGLRLEAR